MQETDTYSETDGKNGRTVGARNGERKTKLGFRHARVLQQGLLPSAARLCARLGPGPSALDMQPGSCCENSSGAQGAACTHLTRLRVCRGPGI